MVIKIFGALLADDQVDKGIDVHPHHVEVGNRQLHFAKDQRQLGAAKRDSLDLLVGDDALGDFLERTPRLGQHATKLQLRLDFRADESLLRVAWHHDLDRALGKRELKEVTVHGGQRPQQADLLVAPRDGEVAGAVDHANERHGRCFGQLIEDDMRRNARQSTKLSARSGQVAKAAEQVLREAVVVLLAAKAQDFEDAQALDGQVWEEAAAQLLLNAVFDPLVVLDGGLGARAADQSKLVHPRASRFFPGPFGPLQAPVY